mgnify:CR=1 FL=1
MIGEGYDNNKIGIRAVICLSSNVQLIPNGNAYDLKFVTTNNDSKDDGKNDDEKQEVTTEEVANDTSYIGKYVNYEVPTGGDPEVKWRIFYADGMNGETVAENDRHIYLISDDYLKYDYVPTKTVNETTYTMIKNGDYIFN